MPGEPGAATHAGDVVEACARSLARAVDTLEPSHAACVLEGAGETWRHRLHPGYKADRPPMPEKIE